MADGVRRTGIVTGANGTIGRAICAGLAERGLSVVMVCRDAKRGRQAMEAVKGQVPGADLRLEIVDVSRRDDVFGFASRWREPLAVLVNNAAIAPKRRGETPEGIEMVFATNVLGYVWMMRAFESALRAAAPGRVVNVASYWAGDLELDDLQFARRHYNNDRAYRQSKQADRMLTVAFAKRWPSSEITVNSCHPGDANSALSNALGFGGHESAEQAADTPIWLATDPSLAGVTGKYFAQRQPRPCEWARDVRALAALDDACARF
jgi:NAD(P)-dependent dehydrogenase (short-subunit alcohol dehydrogenase family)